MDFNKLIARVKGILLTPKTEWPVIAAEPATPASLYTGYILLLAAIPAVCQFLKLGVFGYSLPFLGTMHIGMGWALSAAIKAYLAALIGVYVVALIVNALAPTFGGHKDQVQALKVVTYAYTAGWVAGIGMLLPGLGTLFVVAGIVYGVYLLYLGLPPLMKCPPEKATGYAAVSIIVAIVVSVVLGLLLGGVLGSGGRMGLGGFGFHHGDSGVTIDGDDGKLAQWAQGMEVAGKKLEAAQKSGDVSGAANAVGGVVASAVSGGAKVEALAPDRIKTFLPETLGGLKRVELSAERNGALGMQVAEARARYADDSGSRTLRLEITDMGSARGLMALANAANVEVDRQTQTGYEKTYRQNGNMISEQWDSASKHGEYGALIAERFNVKITGDGADIDALKAAFGGVDLAGLAALKDEGVKTN
jgi:hypothetical protein